MRVLVLGAGAIGGYFGGRLIQAGQDVTFLVRPARKALLQAKGLRIKSVSGDFSSPVKAVTSDELKGDFDVVLLTCKSYDLDSAIESIRPGVGPDTAILPLLNGLSHMDRLNAEFGVGRAWGGTARIFVGLIEDGVIEHVGGRRQITFGEQSGEMSKRVLDFKAALPVESVEAVASDHIWQDMWDKAVQMAVGAGVPGLMRVPIGVIASVPRGSEAVMNLFDVCCAIAAKEGYPISQAVREFSHGVYHDTSAVLIPSLLRDIQNGNPIEGEQIVGHMLEKARKHGISAPALEMIMVSLRVYESQRLAKA